MTPGTAGDVTRHTTQKLPSWGDVRALPVDGAAEMPAQRQCSARWGTIPQDGVCPKPLPGTVSSQGRMHGPGHQGVEAGVVPCIISVAG